MSSYWVLLCIVLLLLLTEDGVISIFPFPSSDLEALQSIFNETNGNNWYWSPSGGNSWNFGAINDTYNPCSANWQYLICSSDCTLAPCSISYLVFVENMMIGQLPDIFDQFSNLISIQIEFQNFLTGTFPQSICTLPYLLSILLTSVSISGEIPSCIGNLSSLQLLYIQNVPFDGSIPPQIGNLSKLQTVVIESTNIGGKIPLTLEKLNLYDLVIIDSYLTGSIPESIFSTWRNLTYLSFGTNILHGTIPEIIYFFPILAQLDFSNNYIFGSISSSIGNLTNLQIFNVYSNYLYGSIPSTIGNLSILRVLGLDNNFFTGTVPVEYCQLQVLQISYLFANFFSGSLPYYFFNMPKLRDLIISFNRFTDDLPPYANAPLLEGLDMALNQLGGSLVVFQALPSLTILLVNDNSFIGTIPTASEQFVTELLYLNVSSNYLSGEVPSNLAFLNNMVIFDVSDNYLTGSSPAMFHNWSQVYNVYLSGNLFSGRADYLFDIKKQVKLGLIDISTNGFTGTIPTLWFQLPNLHSLAAGENCFTGSIPASICTCYNLTFLILDGLHSSSLCRHRLFGTYIPGLSKSLKNIYYLSSAISDGIPSCVFNMSMLQTLHVSGNGIRGSLPSTLDIGASLLDLSLSHNDFDGLIPSSIVEHAWKNLDLSFNKFRGTLSTEVKVSNRLNMQVNRLSGSIPSSVATVPNLNILSGNMFSCRWDGSDLPTQDPSYRTYTCGSDEVNIALEAWLIGLVTALVLILGQIYRTTYLTRVQTAHFGGRDSQLVDLPTLPRKDGDVEKGESSFSRASRSMSISESAQQVQTVLTVWDNMLKWSAMTGIHHVTLSLRSSSSLTTSDTTAMNNTSTPTSSIEKGTALASSVSSTNTSFARGDLSKANYIARFVYIVGRFHRYLLIILSLILLVLLPAYAILTVLYGTYTFQYAWTLSFCFLTGTEPAVIVFVLLLGLLLISMLLLRSRSLLNQSQQSHQQHSPLVTDSTGKNQLVLSWQTRWNTVIAPILIYALFALINFVVVLSVNAAYVFSVGSYSFITVFVITLLVSAFKLIWNNVVVISLVGQFTQHLLRLPVLIPKVTSQHQSRNSLDNNSNNSSSTTSMSMMWSFAASSGNFLFLMFILLFNNIFAPYIAEAFVSSNCFLYTVSSPDPVASTIINPWGCQVDDDVNYNGTENYKTHCGPEIVLPPNSDVLGFTNVSSLTYNPPFIYSYQCSSSLITAFAFVFAYRYIITGILQPLFYLFAKYTQERRFHTLLMQRSQSPTAGASLPDGTTTSENESLYMDWAWHVHTMLVPPLAKFLLPRPTLRSSQLNVNVSLEAEIEKASVFNAYAVQCNGYIAGLLLTRWKSLANYFPAHHETDCQQSDQSSQEKEKEKEEESYKITRAGFIGKAFVLRLISDLTVLLTFGVVFPPLAPLIVWSMLVESYLLVVSLGRYLDVLLRSMSYATSSFTAAPAATDTSSTAEDQRSEQQQQNDVSAEGTGEVEDEDAAAMSAWWRMSFPEKWSSMMTPQTQRTTSSAAEAAVSVDVGTPWVRSQLWGSTDVVSSSAAAAAAAAAVTAATDVKQTTDSVDQDTPIPPSRTRSDNAEDAVGPSPSNMTEIHSLWSLWLVLNDAFRSFRTDLRRGIDISFVSASIFWSFSLLDTVGSSSTSENPKTLAFILLVIMGSAPFWLTTVLQVVLPWVMVPRQQSKSAVRAMSTAGDDATTAAAAAAARGVASDALIGDLDDDDDEGDLDEGYQQYFLHAQQQQHLDRYSRDRAFSAFSSSSMSSRPSSARYTRNTNTIYTGGSAHSIDQRRSFARLGRPSEILRQVFAVPPPPPLRTQQQDMEMTAIS